MNLSKLKNQIFLGAITAFNLENGKNAEFWEHSESLKEIDSENWSYEIPGYKSKTGNQVVIDLELPWKRYLMVEIIKLAKESAFLAGKPFDVGGTAMGLAFFEITDLEELYLKITERGNESEVISESV